MSRPRCVSTPLACPSTKRLFDADTVVVPALASYDAGMPGALVDALHTALRRVRGSPASAPAPSRWRRPECWTAAEPQPTACCSIGRAVSVYVDRHALHEADGQIAT